VVEDLSEPGEPEAVGDEGQAAEGEPKVPYYQTDKGKEAHKRWRSSEKGRAYAATYRQTDKYKEMRKRYQMSEKGKEARKRYQAKRRAQQAAEAKAPVGETAQSTGEVTRPRPRRRASDEAE
jgi:DNA-binding PadR family transcriptional regulator